MYSQTGVEQLGGHVGLVAGVVLLEAATVVVEAVVCRRDAGHAGRVAGRGSLRSRDRASVWHVTLRSRERGERYR